MFKYKPGDIAVINENAAIKSRIGATVKIIEPLHEDPNNLYHWIEFLECPGEPTAVGIQGKVFKYKLSPYVFMNNKMATSLLRR